MRVIFELPDDMYIAMLNIVHGDHTGLEALCVNAGPQDLYDGAVIQSNVDELASRHKD